jgi:AcrR family transcriptional regulator
MARTGAQTKRTPRTRVRKREQEVLEAAARVFHQRGYSDATVQHVADELGILKGSLYYYIKTKEDLLFRLLEQVHDEVDELLAEVSAQTEGQPPLERLEAYVLRQSEHSIRDLVKITVYYHDIGLLVEARRREILDRRKPHEAYVIGLIRQAQQEGAAEPSHDPLLLSNCVFATIIWTYRWYRPNGRVGARQAAETCARYAIAGVVGAGP